jgi:hypothetical protein
MSRPGAAAIFSPQGHFFASLRALWLLSFLSLKKKVAIPPGLANWRIPHPTDNYRYNISQITDNYRYGTTITRNEIPRGNPRGITTKKYALFNFQ